jgi:UDP-N-acetylmuramoylalanine--D-glutamate ligase
MSLRLAIFGVGLSGQAAKRLALARGHEVTQFDEAGGGDKDIFDASQFAGFDRFIFSPGFAADHPWRLQAERSGKPVQSEMSFAAEHWQGPLIGITGTNGKTTLTHLLAEALQRAGKKAVCAGNIGQPLSDIVLDFENVESVYAVCEISSFQAELSAGIQLDGLLWSNFAEDHLDRYESMAHYFEAKAELLKCLKPDAVCVIGPQVVPWLERFNTSFGRAQIAHEAHALMSRLSPESVFTRFPYSENLALAAEFWRLTDAPEEALLAAANEFKLAPYRLDVVLARGGVNYWNDSKATNFHSTLAAVQAVPRPIIWIGGGRIKGGNLEAFAKELAPQIDIAVLYGEAAPQMMEALTDRLEDVRMVPAFDPAVRVAGKLAAACAPASVLLSPGFSSFDQFTSYEARGKSFNSIVLGL